MRADAGLGSWEPRSRTAKVRSGRSASRIFSATYHLSRCSSSFAGGKSCGWSAPALQHFAVRESRRGPAAESRKDFVHKLDRVCLKELRKVRRWLRLIARVDLPRHQRD